MIAFGALMEELSVTKSAEKLRIGQSVVSHNLSTLRMLLPDDLFVRIGQKMQPAAKARALDGPVRAALTQVVRVWPPVPCLKKGAQQSVAITLA